MFPNTDQYRGINVINRWHYKLGVLSKEEIDKNDTFRIEQYGLGTIRTIQEFEEVYKIKFKTKNEILDRENYAPTNIASTASEQIKLYLFL